MLPGGRYSGRFFACARRQVEGGDLGRIKLAIVGVGNCASSLVQGIEYYRGRSLEDSVGLIHWDIGGYRPFDIEVVTAFDVDVRKVGKAISEAPNCTTVFCRDIPKTEVRVRMGRVLDGVAVDAIRCARREEEFR